VFDPNKNYYETFTEAHEVAKKLLKDFSLLSTLGYDKTVPDSPYTLSFDHDALTKAHPMRKRS
jgi:hypothetical protein